MTQKKFANKSAAQLQEYVAEMAQTIVGQGAAEAQAAARPAGGVGNEAPKPSDQNLEMIMSLPVTVKIVMGSVTMPVANLVKLGKGAVIPLDRAVGDPVDVVVNGRTVARGEVVLIDEATSRFGISLTEIVTRKGANKAA